MKTKISFVPRSFRSLAVIAATGALVTLASAQTPANPTPSAETPSRMNADASMPQTALTRSDQHFLEKASMAGREEIAISQVATSRAISSQVRDFAQMMVSDHGQANTELASLASTKGATLPMKEIDVSKWQNKGVSDFDKDYVAKMVSDHKDAVKLFEKAANKADDADIRAWAAKTLPTLQAHLSKVETLKEMIK